MSLQPEYWLHYLRDVQHFSCVLLLFHCQVHLVSMFIDPYSFRQQAHVVQPGALHTGSYRRSEEPVVSSAPFSAMPCEACRCRCTGKSQNLGFAGWGERLGGARASGSTLTLSPLEAFSTSLFQIVLLFHQDVWHAPAFREEFAQPHQRRQKNHRSSHA